MTELYIFSQDDELLTILSEDNGLLEAPINDLLNNVSDTPFVFTVDAQVKYEQSYDSGHNLTQVASMFIGAMQSTGDSELVNVSPAQFVKERNRVALKDRNGDFREFVIDELDDTDDMDGPETTATCLPAWQFELQKNLIEDRRFTDRTAQFALDAALEGTRFVGEVLVELGEASTNFYRLRSTDAIWKIMDVWGGEFKDVILLNNKGRINQRKIQLLQRRGADNGARFEIDHNMDSIERTVISDPVTAMYGWGASLEIEDEDGELTGGHTRYIDFKDVEWKVSNGDPVDKPLGQAWVGDPDALQKYGLEHNGDLLHLYDEFSNQDYEDPEELLWATWEHLQKVKDPEVNYRMSVDLLDKPVELGDTAQGIDRQFARPIEIQARIIGIEYDVLGPEDPAIVEMGQFLSLNDDIIGREIDDIKEKINRPPKPIDENSYSNTKPQKPFGVIAIGAYRTIQLYWEYTDEIYVKHYEVYGSQVADFVPDEQHLLWRGNVSAFAHSVEMDETWYYYVRAVNYHGTPSDYSDRVQASSLRDVTPDIMFGSIKAEQLEENLNLANQLDAGTLDWINAGVYEAINAIQSDITDNIDSIVSNISTDITNLVDRTDGLDGTIVNVYRDMDLISGDVSSVISELSNIDGVMSSHESLIQSNAEAILKRVTSEQLDTVENTFTQAISEVDQRADSIVQQVQQTNVRIDNIDIRGTNFISHLPGNWMNNSNGNDSKQINYDEASVDATRSLALEPNTEYTLQTYGNYSATIAINAGIGGFYTVPPSSSGGHISFTSPSNAHGFFLVIYDYQGNQDINPYMVGDEIKVKLSLGSEPSAWTPNLDDTGQLVSNVQTFVSQFEQRADSIESSVTSVQNNLDDEIASVTREFTTIRQEADNILLAAQSYTDDEGRDIKTNLISYINIDPKTVRIGGEKVAITGDTYIENGIIGTAAIADLAVSRAHLKQAIIEDAHIDNMSGRKIIGETVTADKLNVTNLRAISANMGTLTAGILRSSNNNMELNLNRGTLRMSNADFTLGGGADIEFTDVGNRLYFQRQDTAGSRLLRSAGFGVGRSINDRFPFVYLGTSTSSKPTANDSSNFSGFIANVKQREHEDGIGNSVVGHRFHVRDQAISFSKGFLFNIYASRPYFSGMNSGSYNYDIGSTSNNFDRIYARTFYTDNGYMTFRNQYASGQGFRMDTNYHSDGQLYFRGIHSDDYHSLGTPGGWRFRWIYLRYNPDVSSDIRLKEDIKKLSDGIEVIRNLNPVSYRYKLSKSDKKMGVHRNKKQFGLIAQEVIPTFEKLGYDTSDLVLLNKNKDDFYSMVYQELTPHILDAIKDIDSRMDDKDRRIKKLENKVKELEELAAA